MALRRKTSRKNCNRSYSPITISPKASRVSKSILDTPRRVRLLRDAKATTGKLPRTELFRQHNIAPATGYRILRSNSARRSDGVHKRGRKPILAPFERDAIETVENASFRMASSSHNAAAASIGLAHGSERLIQRNMREHGVETYLT
jgi:hypothetical protein